MRNTHPCWGRLAPVRGERMLGVLGSVLVVGMLSAAPGWARAEGVANVAGAGLTQQAPEAREPLEVNQATEAELQEVPGIGPTMARRIVEWRKKNGRFERLDDLLNVRGIGVKTLAKLRPYLRVDDQPEGVGQGA